MRIFLASTGNLEVYSNKVNKNVSRYILCTFYEGEKACLKAINLSNGVENFLLDSGAFTFMNSKNNITKKELEEYCDRYIAFINKYNIKYFFEMDVDYLFGIEYVEYLRNKIEKETGKQCIPVWHITRGINYWKKLCKEYKYIAIGGLVSSGINISRKDILKIIKKLTVYARSKNVKVHGLGFTTTKELKNIPFYSVDSTSWLKTIVFGASLSKYNNKTHDIKNIDIPNNDNTKKINYSTCLENNFKEWMKYQKYMDTLKW